MILIIPHILQPSLNDSLCWPTIEYWNQSITSMTFSAFPHNARKTSHILFLIARISPSKATTKCNNHHHHHHHNLHITIKTPHHHPLLMRPSVTMSASFPHYRPLTNSCRASNDYSKCFTVRGGRPGLSFNHNHHHHHRPPVKPQNNSRSYSPLVVVDNNKSRRIDSPVTTPALVHLNRTRIIPTLQCSQRSTCHCCNKLHKQASTQVAITQSFSGTLVLITINRPPMRLFGMHKVC